MKHADQKYFTGLMNGDSALIQEIYSRFSMDMIQFVLRNNGNREDARDLFQDALMAIYHQYRSKEFTLTVSLGALIMGIGRRMWMDRLHQKKRDQNVRIDSLSGYNDVQEDQISIIERSTTDFEKKQSLNHSFGMLSEQCRQLLSRISEGVEPEKIRSELQFETSNAMYQSKHRCIARWKTLFWENYKKKIDG